MPSTLSKAQKWKSRDLYIRGYSVDEIAQEIKKPKKAVQSAIVGLSSGRESVTDKEVLQIVDLYEEQGMDVPELAKKFRCRIEVIRWVLWGVGDEPTAHKPNKPQKNWEQNFRRKWRETVGHD